MKDKLIRDCLIPRLDHGPRTNYIGLIAFALEDIFG
jgi:hypothetical protein